MPADAAPRHALLTANPLLIGGICVLAFVGLAANVLLGSELLEADVALAGWLHAHQVAWLTLAMQLVTGLHNEGLIALVAGALILYLMRRGDRRASVMAVVALPGGMLLNAALKQLVHRPRPSFTGAPALSHNYSFPSGHTAGATLLYGLLALYVLTRWPPSAGRTAVWVACVPTPLAVGVSRVYLGVHYPSDALAAVLEGVAWLSVAVLWERHGPLRRHLGARRPAP